MKTKGKVFKGKREGTKIGFPTANIRVKEKIEPGIYAGYANLSENPGKLKALFYVAEGNNIIECHILDFPKINLYGAEISVDIKHKLREVQEFKDLENAHQQIKKDELKARKWFIND